MNSKINTDSLAKVMLEDHKKIHCSRCRKFKDLPLFWRKNQIYKTCKTCYDKRKEWDRKEEIKQQQWLTRQIENPNYLYDSFY